MSTILDLIFGKRLEQATDRYLERLSQAPVQALRQNAERLLGRMRSTQGPKIPLGETMWGEPVDVPISDIVNAHGLVTGGTGSGKTSFALLILTALIRHTSASRTLGCAVLDAKGDLFSGALYIMAKRLEELGQDAKAARDLRHRVVICDFSSRDPVSSYNILARWPGVDPDFFASTRAELLLDLLPGSDHLSLGAAGVLKKLLLLLSEFNLPITSVDEIFENEAFLHNLVSRCRNRATSAYFTHRFRDVPKPTIAALRRRLDALFSSESVRLALAGTTAPDFRLLQDEAKIVLLNCFGENISRGVRRLLQGLVLSDIRQSVFARRNKDCAYLWLCDEAQNFFLTEKLRESMADLLTMARSFGSHFLYLTQNISTAVSDGRLLGTLFTNLRWSFSMRGEPADCAFLKPVLPVTGRKRRPQTNPFEEPAYYSLAEERAMELEAVAGLPDRHGYLWFRAGSPEAVRIKTAPLAIPQGRELAAATLQIRHDPGIGMRMSRREYDRAVAERDQAWGAPEEDLGDKLEQAYKRTRRKGQS